MSTMKIRQAFEKAINSMLPALATAWENDDYTPIAGTPYQKVNFIFAEPENNEIGVRHRELGYVQVTLMYPQKGGVADAGNRAELLRDTFPRGASVSKDGVTAIVEKTPTVEAGYRDGDRWAVPVKVRFFSNV